MRTILCIGPKIADLQMRDFVALRMEDLICFTPSGDGNPKAATCPGFYQNVTEFIAQCYKNVTY